MARKDDFNVKKKRYSRAGSVLGIGVCSRLAAGPVLLTCSRCGARNRTVRPADGLCIECFLREWAEERGEIIPPHRQGIAGGSGKLDITCLDFDTARQIKLKGQ